MARVVQRLFLVVAVLLCVVVAMALMRGTPILEMAPLMLILFMSAIPRSLPVMFTVSMAIGSKELAKRGVLVKGASAPRRTPRRWTCSAWTRPARSR